MSSYYEQFAGKGLYEFSCCGRTRSHICSNADPYIRCLCGIIVRGIFIRDAYRAEINENKKEYSDPYSNIKREKPYQIIGNILVGDKLHGVLCGNCNMVDRGSECDAEVLDIDRHNYLLRCIRILDKWHSVVHHKTKGYCRVNEDGSTTSAKEWNEKNVKIGDVFCDGGFSRDYYKVVEVTNYSFVFECYRVYEVWIKEDELRKKFKMIEE